MRLNGGTFKRDETGLISIVMPWEVSTLDDCILFIPDPAPYGLPIVDRSAEEFTVGTWTLKLTYEGGGTDNVTFDSDAAIDRSQGGDDDGMMLRGGCQPEVERITSRLAGGEVQFKWKPEALGLLAPQPERRLVAV